MGCSQCIQTAQEDDEGIHMPVAEDKQVPAAEISGTGRCCKMGPRKSAQCTILLRQGGVIHRRQDHIEGASRHHFEG